MNCTLTRIRFCTNVIKFLLGNSHCASCSHAITAVDISLPGINTSEDCAEWIGMASPARGTFARQISTSSYDRGRTTEAGKLFYSEEHTNHWLERVRVIYRVAVRRLHPCCVRPVIRRGSRMITDALQAYHYHTADQPRWNSAQRFSGAQPHPAGLSLEYLLRSPPRPSICQTTGFYRKYTFDPIATSPHGASSVAVQQPHIAGRKRNSKLHHAPTLS